MNWKDTIIHAKGCTTNLGVIGATCNCGAEMQAEISFKAGIREVRKWLDSHAVYRATPHTTELPFLGVEDYERLYLALQRDEMPEEASPTPLEQRE